MLPGEDLVEEGIVAAGRGEWTVAALLVAIGRHRIGAVRALPAVDWPRSPEHRLYALLAAEFGDDAHGRYNALIRRLVSYERALERGVVRAADRG